jgi:hypothetical protein
MLSKESSEREMNQHTYNTDRDRLNHLEAMLATLLDQQLGQGTSGKPIPLIKKSRFNSTSPVFNLSSNNNCV